MVGAVLFVYFAVHDLTDVVWHVEKNSVPVEDRWKVLRPRRRWQTNCLSWQQSTEAVITVYSVATLSNHTAQRFAAWVCQWWIVYVVRLVFLLTTFTVSQMSRWGDFIVQHTLKIYSFTAKILMINLNWQLMIKHEVPYTCVIAVIMIAKCWLRGWHSKKVIVKNKRNVYLPSNFKRT